MITLSCCSCCHYSIFVNVIKMLTICMYVMYICMHLFKVYMSLLTQLSNVSYIVIYKF